MVEASLIAALTIEKRSTGHFPWTPGRTTSVSAHVDVIAFWQSVAVETMENGFPDRVFVAGPDRHGRDRSVGMELRQVVHVSAWIGGRSLSWREKVLQNLATSQQRLHGSADWFVVHRGEIGIEMFCMDSTLIISNLQQLHLPSPGWGTSPGQD